MPRKKMLEITIKGGSGAGKSSVAYFLLRALRAMGLRASLDDTGGAGISPAAMSDIENQLQRLATQGVEIEIRTVQQRKG